MEYRIVGVSIKNGWRNIAISKSEYDVLLKARNGLNAILSFEETFDVLMGNYADLESAILETALSAMLFREHDDALDIYIARSLVGRRVLNFLSSARLYRDSYRAHVVKVFGRRATETHSLVTLLDGLASNSHAYRFIEQLRNSAQHSELPVHSITFSFSNVDEDSSSTSVIPKIIPKMLLSDRDFPPDLLKAMSPNGEEFELMPPLREYLEKVPELHHQTRDVFRTKDSEWREQYRSVLRKIKEAYPKDEITLIRAQPEKPQHNDDQIFLQLGKYRDFLAKKHRKIGNLSKHFVSWR